MEEEEGDDKINLKPIGLEVMDWIHLAHESDKQHDNEPLGSIKVVLLD